MAARRWWGRTAEPVLAVPYEITCSCGQVVRGLRQRQHQAVRCSGCTQALFVLPCRIYPLPEQLAPARPKASGDSSPYFRASSWPWLLPLLAAGLTLAAVVFVFALVLPGLGRHATPSSPAPVDADEIRAHVQAGQKALAEGSFQLALEELTTACVLRDQHPELISAADGRKLNQLQREAALLAALLRNSLQEILNQAASVRREQEWKAQFRNNYRGRTVIFDDVVRREPDGRCQLAVYEVRQGDTTARLELGALTLLQRLPLDKPRRLLFGARLDSVEREDPGVWVIRFLPDSGVLLTDPEAAAATAPLPLDDELRAVLRRQAEWAAELP